MYQETIKAPLATSDIGLTRIYYLCPDISISSAGIRRLYRHVQLLVQAGFNAHILHLHTGFQRTDMPKVPVAYLDRHPFAQSDIVIIPEGFPEIMDALKSAPGRRFVIALNWDYIFKNLPMGLNYSAFNIERVLAVSPAIGQMIEWSMGLPAHIVESSIDHTLYYFDMDSKCQRVVYIQRKAENIDILKRLLGARNPLFTDHIEWVSLDGLPEAEYAAQIRTASVFLNLSHAEGFPTSCLEAMAAGTLVVGYDSMGGRDLLRGQGDHQNSHLSQIGDYITISYILDAILIQLLDNKTSGWRSILDNARDTAARFTLENESASLISFWQTMLKDAPQRAWK